jgi:hypothetical protein
MPSLPTRIRLLFAASLFLALVPAVHAGTSDGKWAPMRSEGRARSLRYSGTAVILGKPIPIELTFFCDPEETATIHGALGFDLFLGKIADLAPFHFDDFEGPDAPVSDKKLLQVTIARKGKSPQSFSMVPSGWYAPPDKLDGKAFGFGVSEVSHRAKSTPKSLLQALGDDAESLRLTITDDRDANVKLEIVVPLAGKQSDFKALLAGLK